MKTAVRKVSTNGGIVSPHLDARIDLARFQSGCLEMTNQIPDDSGSSVTRPGLIYDLRLNRSTVIHPYIVSASVSYLLLFSDQELRIVRDGQLVTVNGGEAIATPYLEADLFELKVDSLVDLLWIAHPNYPPHQLSRVTENDWTFEELPYIYPPMIPRLGEVTKLTPSAETGNIILTADTSDFFFSGHVGSYWKVGHDLEASVVELSLDRDAGGATSDWLPVSGAWSFVTAGNWISDIKIERRYNGETKTIRWFKSRSETQNIETTGTEEPGTELRIVAENADGYSEDGVVQAPAYSPSASITVSNTKLYGLVQITAVNSGTEAEATVIRKMYSTDETDLWEEGAWSDFRGYPANVQEHERRLMFSGSRSFPNRYWSSRQDDRQDFDVDDDDDQAPFSFDLPSRDVVSWMLSEKQLLIGTRAEEVVITSGRDDLALSPENSRARTNGSIGSSRVQPVKNSGAILYAERRGRRIRQLTDSEGIGVYANTDVTAFAPHLFDSYVVQMATAQLNQKLVFVLLSNRKLLCLNHNLDQQIASWFVIETQGDFESVAALPGDLSEDVVYVITRREINGETVRQLEHFAVNQWDLIESGDTTSMVYSDMAKVIESEAEIEDVTGLDDWEGETVQILGDGGVQPNQVVTGGKITLTDPSKVVILGLPYESAMTPLWFEDLESPSQGRKRKIAKLFVAMYQGGNVTMQATDDDAFGELSEAEELQAVEISRRRFSDLLGEAPSLETGYFEVSLESRHSRKQSVRFSRNSPLPMVIQSIHLIYNIGDK